MVTLTLVKLLSQILVANLMDYFIALFPLLVLIAQYSFLIHMWHVSVLRLSHATQDESTSYPD